MEDGAMARAIDFTRKTVVRGGGGI